MTRIYIFYRAWIAASTKIVGREPSTDPLNEILTALTARPSNV